MELRQIRYFVAVAEDGNFGAAARRLNVSQPPITRQVKKLEDELGVTLLVRTPKGAELTTAGRTFLEDARQVLAQVARGVERSRAAQRGELGTLDVAYFGSAIYRIVPSILQAFRAAHPHVEVALHRMSKSEQIDALRAGRIHIGFGRYFAPEPDITIKTVYTEGLALAVPADFEETPPEPDCLSIFESTPLVLFPERDRPNFADEVMGVLKREGVDPKIAAVTEDVRSALTLTAIGTGATIVPGTVAEFSWSGVRFVPLEKLNTDCAVSCVYRKSETSPLFRAIQAIVRDYQH